MALSLALDLGPWPSLLPVAKSVLTVDDKEVSKPITMSDCRIVVLLTVRAPNGAD